MNVLLFRPSLSLSVDVITGLINLLRFTHVLDVDHHTPLFLTFNVDHKNENTESMCKMSE